MKITLFLISIIILIVSHSSHADTTSITLQNGLDGYNGCEDSYNFTEYPDTNYSTYNELQLFNCIP